MAIDANGNIYNPGNSYATNADTGEKKPIYYNRITGAWQNTPGPAAPEVPILQLPDMGYTAPQTGGVSTPSLSFDPLLSPESVLGGVKSKLDQNTGDIARRIVEPQLPLVTQAVENFINQQKSSAQSDFLARGLTGGSTEVQTLTRDLPAAGAKALSDATTKLIADAIPQAQNEKQLALQGASLATQWRQMLGTEKFNMLSLDQRAKIADADRQTQVKLAQIDMQFKAKLAEAQMRFEAAQNQEDRLVADEQFRLLQKERSKAREQAFFQGLIKTGVTIGTQFLASGAGGGGGFESTMLTGETMAAPSPAPSMASSGSPDPYANSLDALGFAMP